MMRQSYESLENGPSYIRMRELEETIAALPPGSMTTKRVNGHEYVYRRWSEQGKRHEQYVPADEAEALRAQIQHRKSLEAELKALRAVASRAPAPRPLSAAPDLGEGFATNVLTGSALRAFSSSVRSYKRRACFGSLRDFVFDDGFQDKVLVLYGLRRTGKTTLIRQILADMDDGDLAQAAFIQVTARDTLAEVNRDLKRLEAQGCRYVFMDEVTLMGDFIEGAALFSDVFAPCGMRIVLSGTDSLGFLFAEDEQLYDRCVLLHTTFIPYREFEGVLGIHGIDEYIRYGGTMSLGGVRYNEASTFATKERADEYVDASIARNIQHSLRCYQHGGHFRHLQDLYERDELTSAINRVVEDINHRFTLEVLTRKFRSNDLALSARNLRRDRNAPTDILDRIDIAAVTGRLRELLEIRDQNERTVCLAEAHVAEIREYLQLLDLVQEIDVVSLPNVGRRAARTVISQPGLRYAQADALVESLLLDERFADLSLAERNAVLDRIRSEIKGRMMEDIVLLETKLANPGKQVFVLQFPIGEFDMVVFDPVAASCEIFEIKHSAEADPRQYRHLVDPEKCAATEHRFGPIEGKYVVYRGEDREVSDAGVRYLNVEGYLCGLGACTEP